MRMVLLTALGVGGATVIGALIGFVFKKASHKFSDIVLAFAAGVMLAAAVLGLIMPSVEYGIEMLTPMSEESTSPVVAKLLALVMTVAGVFVGAVCLNLVDRLVPHLHKMADVDQESHNNRNAGKVLLFVMAIAIHNLPEGMVIIGPMLAAGIKPRKTFAIALGTGLVEVVGTLIGYFSVSVSAAILPFALAFAGGTMLYIISAEMIPETHAHGCERGATYALLVGFCVMLISDVLLG